MSEKKETHPKEYTPEDIYQGYYWLILHTDPYHGGIIPRKYWELEKPDWVKTTYPDNSINTWFAPKGIPLFKVSNKEIKSWRDMEILWENVRTWDKCLTLFYGGLRWDSVSKRFYGGRKIEPLSDYAWRFSSSKELYDYNGENILNAIESYLEPQHKQRERKATETPIEAGKPSGQAVRLELIVKDKEAFIGFKKGSVLDRQVSFDEQPYALPDTSFRFLYALARVQKLRPGKIVTNDIFLALIKGQSDKTISKHIGTITDRIPPLKTFIENKPKSGYRLALPPETIKIDGILEDVERVIKDLK